MQRTLTAESAARFLDAYPVGAHAPEQQDDLAFFSGLWAIVPVALGGWAMIVWAALQLLR